MLKALVLTLTCAVAYSSANHIFHSEPIKKQAVYSSYSSPSNERFYGPQAQPNPLIQSNSSPLTQSSPSPLFQSNSSPLTQSSPSPLFQSSSSPLIQSSQPVQAAPAPQPIVYRAIAPQQRQYVSAPLNAIPGQFGAKQQLTYYPQFYPPPQQQAFPPSFVYVPPQPSRFPAAAEGTDQQGSQWFNWGSQQWPSFPANWPSGGNIPSNPFGGANFPTQFPSNFPSNFPGSGNFPGQFPGAGNFPGIGGGAPAAPGGVPASGPETGPGTTTNTEGNSVVVVGSKDKPEKFVTAEPTPEITKSENELKSSFEQPQPQYVVLGQPQLYGGQIAAFQGEKVPPQLSNVGKGAISSFLIQPQPYIQQQLVPQLLAQQALSSQQTPVQQQSVPQQQSGQLVSQQFLAQQPLPQQLFAQQFLPPQFYSQQLLQQPQQQQQILPQQFGQQFVSQKQPVEVSNLPGASLAYQRFLQQSKQPEVVVVKSEPKVEISSPSNDGAVDDANSQGSDAESSKAQQ